MPTRPKMTIFNRRDFEFEFFNEGYEISMESFVDKIALQLRISTEEVMRKGVITKVETLDASYITVSVGENIPNVEYEKELENYKIQLEKYIDEARKYNEFLIEDMEKRFRCTIEEIKERIAEASKTLQDLQKKPTVINKYR